LLRKLLKSLGPGLILWINDPSYGTWSLKLIEEHRLRVFENRVLRRIFGPKRDEVTGRMEKIA
jgi:hypothetical protein